MAIESISSASEKAIIRKKARHSGAQPAVSNGRPADMSWEAVRHRLLQHVLPGLHGNALVTIRIADIKAVVELADHAAEADEAMQERDVAHARIARALRILKPDLAP